MKQILKNKVIVVTGGAGLLGRAMIDFFISQEAIAINADLLPNNAASDSYAIDITSEDSVKSCIEYTVKKYGKIDGWVNNAYPRSKDWAALPENVPFSSWQSNIDMHLNGYYLCSSTVLEFMKKNNIKGSIVNMSSIYGVVGPDFTIYAGTSTSMPVAYSAIKGAIVNLTKFHASYYGKNNIRVNCVSPGGILNHQEEQFIKNYNAKVPLNRMADVKEIPPSVAFLLSDSATYITGHNLMVDGGWTAI